MSNRAKPAMISNGLPTVALSCLRCTKAFQSGNKRTNRLCADCRRGSEGFDAPWVAGGNTGRRVQEKGRT